MRKFFQVSWSRGGGGLKRRRIGGGMQISLLNSLFLLSSLKNTDSKLVHKYYRGAEDVLKVLKPILNGIVHTQIASDDLLQNAFSQLGQATDELRELFETWQPWSSKIYFVLQAESLITQVQSCSLKIIQLLISSYWCLSGESSLRWLEGIEKIIVLVTHMRECVVMMKRSENLPADFCYSMPLSMNSVSSNERPFRS